MCWLCANEITPADFDGSLSSVQHQRLSKIRFQPAELLDQKVTCRFSKQSHEAFGCVRARNSRIELSMAAAVESYQG